MTKEQIHQQRIEQARAIHGDKYDYSKADFTKVGVKTCIICPEHGEFYQCAGIHLRGHGCPKCAGNAVISIQEFIEKANKIHNNKYDYSNVKFTKMSDKVCIICPEHGEFYQSVKAHLSGQGCPKCANGIISLQEFIEKARAIHGDKYDYSKVKFTKMSDKVCIICPEHGEFYQSVKAHLSGQGCPKCANGIISLQEFIEKARAIHGDKYDYSKVKFTKMRDKVCIICPEHGEFYQSVSAHLSGQGCPNCAGVRKSYKFDLLKEFESEYALRDFLMTNHVFILIKILTNLCERSPKFKPIEDDLRKALMNKDKVNPIKYLEEKYSGMTADEMETDTKIDINDIDWDDDDAIDQIASKNDAPEKEITIADLTKSERNVQKVLSKIKNMVTPEIREQIEAKYVNDKIRQYFDEYGM